MSGVTLAVAPRSEPDTTTTTTDKNRSKRPPEQPLLADRGGVMGSLRIIELQLVAFIMVFSVSGLVPLLDLVFPAFTTAYLFALTRFAFPSHGHVASASKEIFQGSKLLRFYVIMGTTIGLFLPLAYVLGGFARGDERAVRSATPHLFLLSFQILTENIISGLSLFSPPVRAVVPVLYTEVAWYWFGRCLAMSNLVYFSINLFVFLIPRFLPRAFERYFKERDEVHDKMAEDKRPAAMNKSQPTDKKAN
ncbi:hypothetical protein L484_017463 [Morus notabilis]|uniref:DUF7733 domain-containing protein n=1 Tax=Morus notabilis TaxID=981085 RepID=W9R7T1_9ROSA|nr:hypothetical protein L484_017463 [Morus notabilis]